MRITLRGMILSKFRTVGEFSDAIGWSRGKASRIINGQQRLDMDDIVEITKVLNIEDIQVFSDIFFPQLSTMWTESSVCSNQ